MRAAELEFERPEVLQAVAPAEASGQRRDSGRLLVSRTHGHTHAEFVDLPLFLEEGDLLVVNESATIAASLPASNSAGSFIINLSTRYGPNLWLVEPRISPEEPGPLNLQPGQRIEVGGVRAVLIGPYPGLDRLWFLRSDEPLEMALEDLGSPIRYGYVDGAYPLSHYQTLFARVPGSAEMPSAARPFTTELVAELDRRGIAFARLVLHTGVSSLEVEVDEIENQPLYPEPFEVPELTALLVNRTRRLGRRVVAVGTTVARALEAAWDGDGVRPARGFTRVYIHPERGIHAFDSLLTGFHDSKTTHLALLYAVVGKARILEAYAEAVRCGYLWHEFGDSHLIFR